MINNFVSRRQHFPQTEELQTCYLTLYEVANCFATNLEENIHKKNVTQNYDSDLHVDKEFENLIKSQTL